MSHHYEAEHARLADLLARIPARLDAVGIECDECTECRRWRDMKHPIQGGTCDEHWRKIRALHATRDELERGLREIAALRAAYEDGARSMRERAVAWLAEWGDGDAEDIIAALPLIAGDKR